MAYVPDPTDITQPTDSVIAETAAAEFRAIKAYMQTLVVSGVPGPTGAPGADAVVDTASVLAALAGLGVGAIGSLAFLNNTGADLNPGDTVLGSTLFYSSTGIGIGAAPAGTWRCLGFGQADKSTLFIRIS